MRVSITFYGTTIGSDGMPDPYYVYSIWERAAPWQGTTWKVATIFRFCRCTDARTSFSFPRQKMPRRGRHSNRPSKPWKICPH